MAIKTMFGTTKTIKSDSYYSDFTTRRMRRHSTSNHARRPSLDEFKFTREWRSKDGKNEK